MVKFDGSILIKAVIIETKAHSKLVFTYNSSSYNYGNNYNKKYNNNYSNN